MIRIDVLDETGRESLLADQITGMLEDTAVLVADITALTPPSVVRFRLLGPRAWRAEVMADIRRQIDASFAQSAPSPKEAVEARTAERTYRASTVAGWWMTAGKTVLDAAGEPQTIIAPRALHHTGLRYASNQLYRLVVHESVHHWQIATSRGAVMPVPFLRRDIEVSHQSLVQLWEGHAHWVVQEVARRLFGQDKRPAAQALRRSWRYRRQIELMRWLARRAHGDDVLGQAEGRLHQIRGQGLRWVEAAIEGAGGVGPFNKVWHDPWYAPTADEVTNPERWFSRVGF